MPARATTKLDQHRALYGHCHYIDPTFGCVLVKNWPITLHCTGCFFNPFFSFAGYTPKSCCSRNTHLFKFFSSCPGRINLMTYNLQLYQVKVSHQKSAAVTDSQPLAPLDRIRRAHNGASGAQPKIEHLWMPPLVKILRGNIKNATLCLGLHWLGEPVVAR